MALSQEYLTKKLEQLKAQHQHSGSFYFFTDIQNLVPIFSSGRLLCRKRALEQGLIVSDGASPKILSQTPDWVKNYVRLYFAPRTPMLYQTEGIKRADNGWPECPAPAYLVFPATILCSGGVMISDGNMGSQYTNCSLADESVFDALPLQDIFHRGPLGMNPIKRWEIMRCRHAEVLVPSELDLGALSKIVFRSVGEKQRALKLLGDQWDAIAHVEKPWFFADELGRPYLEAFERTAEGKTILSIANPRTGDTLVHLEANASGGYVIRRTNVGAQGWAEWVESNQQEAPFATSQNGNGAFFLNGRRILEIPKI